MAIYGQFGWILHWVGQASHKWYQIVRQMCQIKRLLSILVDYIISISDQTQGRVVVDVNSLGIDYYRHLPMQQYSKRLLWLPNLVISAQRVYEQVSAAATASHDRKVGYHLTIATSTDRFGKGGSQA
jgi:hypothetical protein